MNKTHKTRLRKLADALINGTHGLAKFDYSVTLGQSACGTIGCAMGACPSVFPRSFRTASLAYPLLRVVSTDGANDSAALRDFFGINDAELGALFYGERLGPLRYVSNMERYSAKQVAKRILRFLDWKEQQK